MGHYHFPFRTVIKNFYSYWTFFQSIISYFIWNFFWFIVQLLYILFIKKINRGITLFILCSSSLIFIIECIVKNTFQVYMPFSSILKGLVESQPVLHPICLNRFYWFICDCIIFISFYFILLFKQKKYPAYQYKWPAIVMNFILSLCLFMVTILFASIGSNSGRYKSQF